MSAATLLRNEENILTAAELEYVLALPEVSTARQAIDAKSAGSVYFSVALTPAIKAALRDRIGLDLTAVDAVPMRWIKGDTRPHIDTGARAFDSTYLMYLTDSPGEFLVDGAAFPIAKGTAYVFSEGLRHETAGTGAEPRLLLGPMSGEGFAVGGPSTIYIRQEGSDVQTSSDQSSWSIVSWPYNVYGFQTVEFVTDITLTADDQYFICNGSNITFGSRSLKEDGSRPVITVAGVTGYPGLIRNGDVVTSGNNDVYVYNLKVVATGGSVLAEGEGTGAGWIGQEYYAKNTGSNYIINCASTGPIGNACGGIVGSDSGYTEGLSLVMIGCSSSGAISGVGAGGIAGPRARTFGCESCWSTGVISGEGAGGIVGTDVEYANIISCYSEGAITGQNAGGIFGKNIRSNLNITNSYSRGDITGVSSGGIIGAFPYGNVAITNCYSAGDINGSDNAGGICGQLDLDLLPSYSITNCYVSGATSGGQGYIIGANSAENNGDSVTACYSEAANGASGWSSTNAAATLIGVPSPVVGSNWVATVFGQPYEIRNMGYSPYTREIIIGNSLSNTKTNLNLTVGGEVEKDMDNADYTAEFDPNEFQSTFFPGMADFIADNIVAGDKAEEDRLRASYWNDLGDDIFDDWGYFYLYDVTFGKYYFPLLSPQNEADGILTTQTFSVFGRTFTITHGWATQGIFKFDISATGTGSYRFGAYGNMGSDGNQDTSDLTREYTVGGESKTLYYRRDADNGSSNEILYTYFLPATTPTSQPYAVYYDDDDMSMVTETITGGLTVYFAKTNDVVDWVVNDVKVAAGESEGGIPAGESIETGLVAGRNYTILQINGGDPDSYATIALDLTTGQFTTTAETAPGMYTIYIRNTGSYNISTYTLIVAEPGAEPEVVTCCSGTLDVKGMDDRTRLEVMMALSLENGYRREAMSYGDLMKLKMMHVARR